MNDGIAAPETGLMSNDPFGMSRYNIRRYSVQHFLLIVVTNLLLVGMTVLAAIQGEVLFLALSAVIMAVVLVKTALVVKIGLRTIEVEIWIRRLGMGDFEYRIEPWGHDEVSKACLALETLRLNCIKAMQLDLVTRLSNELQERNGDLERALDDLRESQDRIISQQKLAELGELSSGVAHEMRNPLQFIANFTEGTKELTAELVELLEQPGEVAREEARDLLRDIAGNMDRVEHHSDRLKSISSAMMVYDRGTGGGFRGVELNRLLEDQANLGKQASEAYEPGFGVEVATELDPEVGEVAAVPEDLARMIVNLVMNACSAMAEMQRSAGNAYQPQLTVISGRHEGGVVVQVLDNGVGMSEDTKSRMFNPFFTTWNTGRNTGLGLSLVWDIVREHGGTIEAESEPGRGTVMTVLLPDATNSQTQALHDR